MKEMKKVHLIMAKFCDNFSFQNKTLSESLPYFYLIFIFQTRDTGSLKSFFILKKKRLS